MLAGRESSPFRLGDRKTRLGAKQRCARLSILSHCRLKHCTGTSGCSTRKLDWTWIAGISGPRYQHHEGIFRKTLCLQKRLRSGTYDNCHARVLESYTQLVCHQFSALSLANFNGVTDLLRFLDFSTYQRTKSSWDRIRKIQQRELVRDTSDKHPSRRFAQLVCRLNMHDEYNWNCCGFVGRAHREMDLIDAYASSAMTLSKSSTSSTASRSSYASMICAKDFRTLQTLHMNTLEPTKYISTLQVGFRLIRFRHSADVRPIDCVKCCWWHVFI